MAFSHEAGWEPLRYSWCGRVVHVPQRWSGVPVCRELVGEAVLPTAREGPRVGTACVSIALVLGLLSWCRINLGSPLTQSRRDFELPAPLTSRALEPYVPSTANVCVLWEAVGVHADPHPTAPASIGNRTSLRQCESSVPLVRERLDRSRPCHLSRRQTRRACGSHL